MMSLLDCCLVSPVVIYVVLMSLFLTLNRYTNPYIVLVFPLSLNKLMPVGILMIYGKFFFQRKWNGIWSQCSKYYFFLLNLERCKTPCFTVLFKMMGVCICLTETCEKSARQILIAFNRLLT